MTKTTTLTDFLLARIAEDEDAAWAASNPPWIALTMFPNRSEVINETEIDGGVIVRTPSKDDSDVGHIARHDPARVLAECEAKRRIVAQYEAAVVASAEETDTETGWIKDGVEKALAATLRALALPHLDHPDYREEWKP